MNILYLFHGLGRDHQQWFSFNIAGEADRLIEAGQIEPLIIVSPWQRAGLDFEKAIPEVLVPYVEETYLQDDTHIRRAVGGLSRGAAWAFRIGFKHPQAFRAVGLHSPAVFEFDRGYLYYWVEGLPPWLIPDVLVDIGLSDSLLPEAEQLTEVLDQRRIQYEYQLLEGDHTSEYWSGNIVRYLRWYDQALRAKNVQLEIPPQ